MRYKIKLSAQKTTQKPATLKQAFLANCLTIQGFIFFSCEVFCEKKAETA
jgi:hypothetical protein